MFSVDGADVGGMLGVSGKPSSWLFYVTVGDIDAAATRIERHGAAEPFD